MKLLQEEIVPFQQKILAWYQQNKRDLPWRHTRDPYKILVSEVMLQQTQVSRVISKHEEWLKHFPDVETLAKASITAVLTHWMGLGYNRRALYLQKTAKLLNESRIPLRLSEASKNLELRDDTGYWPKTIEGLKDLPGVGEYTARAIACFAFDKQVAVVDTNVRKVILVEFGRSRRSGVAESHDRISKKDAIAFPDKNRGSLQHDNTHEIVTSRKAGLAMTEKEIEQIAEQLLPQGRARDWNQALMDYASAVLKKEKIPIPKQSKYLGSDRYYRAKILKLLLAEKTIPLKNLGSMLRKDFTHVLNPWLEKIVVSLEKDELVLRKNNFLTIRH